jgi:hypothetical protein
VHFSNGRENLYPLSIAWEKATILMGLGREFPKGDEKDILGI